MYNYNTEYVDGIIYKYTNKINGKSYIGQTINETRRYNEHKLAKEDCPFHRAIRKYGFKNFKYTVLFRIHCNNCQDLINTLNTKEKSCIKFFKTLDKQFGYNLTSGGDSWVASEALKMLFSKMRSGENNPMFGRHHTNEAKEKISKHKTGKKMPAGFAERVSEQKRGVKFTEEHKKNLSTALKGRIITPEARKKISEKRLGTKSPATSSPVVQFSREGQFMFEYSSLKDAEQKTGIKADNIRACCTKAKKGSTTVSAGGYLWRYKSCWDGNNIEPCKQQKALEVLKLDPITEEIIEEYANLTEAAKNNSILISNLSAIVNNHAQRKTCGGYKWKYKNDVKQ